MGIVNVTPDSFSDGGVYGEAHAAAQHCEALVRQGADILDIGGESSRPGAIQLSAQDEWQRIEPVLRAALGLGVPVSVDTCKVEVMRRALDVGVDIVNDIRALSAPGAMELLAAHGTAGVCLMHMRGDSATMQGLTDYTDVVREVTLYLQQRCNEAQRCGLAAERVVLDPGYGFAKTTQQNFELLRRQAELLALGRPVLAGWSRKSSLGVVTGRPVEERLAASLAAAVLALEGGARILRVHDVAPTVDVVKVWLASHEVGAVTA
ncbi:dihydropteroate synthase [Roseateles sp. BYS180W]|uniref:dihydropteroate synthase n=1 Tax=Roseateles rivi TaxID=3299028 RepID=A0ABW7FZ04_9BURK